MARKREAIDAVASGVDAQGQTLFERVTGYLTEQEWTFTVVEPGQVVSFALRLHDATVRMFVDATQVDRFSRLVVFCVFPVYVPQPRRQAIAEAIARVNHGCLLGFLELDVDDGELRVRAILEGDFPIGGSMIDRALRKSVDLADQYLAPLLAIAFGHAAPADVLAMASRGQDATLQ